MRKKMCLTLPLMMIAALVSVAQTEATHIDTVTPPQPLVSASEATLLTTASLMKEETLNKFRLNDDLNEIPLKSNRPSKNKISKARFKVAKVFTNCTRDMFEMRVELNRPFHGIVYAKDFPHECKARGTSSSNITLRLPTSGCGVRVEPRTDGSMELSVRIMMQMEEKLRQSSDILKTIKCKLPLNAMGMILKGMEIKNTIKPNLRYAFNIFLISQS